MQTPDREEVEDMDCGKYGEHGADGTFPVAFAGNKHKA
jgi:hypothetical protein